jgi:hypothetical protein
MDRLEFFQGILVALAFLSLGGSLLHESISLLGGALLCSLALVFAYFLWKQRMRGKYL